jgi:hypothetical protein
MRVRPNVQSAAIIRRRSRNGTARIGPTTPAFPAYERRLVLCFLVFVAGALFVSGLAPLMFLGGIAFSCAFVEILLVLEKLLALARGRPLAQVHELPRRY